MYRQSISNVIDGQSSAVDIADIFATNYRDLYTTFYVAVVQWNSE